MYESILPARVRPDTSFRPKTRWRKILVVIDPAAPVQPALEKAARIALQTGGSLELYICDVRRELPESWAGGDHLQQYREILRRRAEAEMESFARPLRDDGLAVMTRYEWHAPLEEGIGHHVIRTGPDLVVKETHRHGIASRASVNHTDWNLIQQLPTDLLLVRRRSWAEAPRFASAVDPLHPAERPVELDERIAQAGIALAGALHGSMEIFHVLETPPHLPVDPVPEERRLAAHSSARNALTMLGDRISAPVRFAEGGAAEGIVDLARQHLPDVLIMGSVARQRAVRAAAGGTAVLVLEHVDCDLLVMKPTGFVSPLLITTD